MVAYPIWQMKFCTKEIMIDTMKVSGERTYIYFVADRNYPNLYSMDSAKVRANCKIASNGKIYCYYVPLHMLRDEGPIPASLLEVKQREYEKYKKYMEKGKQNK